MADSKTQKELEQEILKRDMNQEDDESDIESDEGQQFLNQQVRDREDKNNLIYSGA